VAERRDVRVRPLTVTLTLLYPALKRTANDDRDLPDENEPLPPFSASNVALGIQHAEHPLAARFATIAADHRAYAGSTGVAVAPPKQAGPVSVKAAAKGELQQMDREEGGLGYDGMPSSARSWHPNTPRDPPAAKQPSSKQAKPKSSRPRMVDAACAMVRAVQASSTATKPSAAAAETSEVAAHVGFSKAELEAAVAAAEAAGATADADWVAPAVDGSLIESFAADSTEFELAQYLGVEDLNTELYLLGVVRQAMEVRFAAAASAPTAPAVADNRAQPPLPYGWAEAKDGKGNTYYFHKQKRVTQWDHPVDESFRAAIQRERAARGVAGAGGEATKKEEVQLVAAPPPGKRKPRQERSELERQAEAEAAQKASANAAPSRPTLKAQLKVQISDFQAKLAMAEAKVAAQDADLAELQQKLGAANEALETCKEESDGLRAQLEVQTAVADAVKEQSADATQTNAGTQREVGSLKTQVLLASQQAVVDAATLHERSDELIAESRASKLLREELEEQRALNAELQGEVKGLQYIIVDGGMGPKQAAQSNAAAAAAAAAAVAAAAAGGTPTAAAQVHASSASPPKPALELPLPSPIQSLDSIHEDGSTSALDDPLLAPSPAYADDDSARKAWRSRRNTPKQVRPMPSPGGSPSPSQRAVADARAGKLASEDSMLLLDLSSVLGDAVGISPARLHMRQSPPKAGCDKSTIGTAAERKHQQHPQQPRRALAPLSSNIAPQSASGLACEPVATSAVPIGNLAPASIGLEHLPSGFASNRGASQVRGAGYSSEREYGGSGLGSLQHTARMKGPGGSRNIVIASE